MRRSTPSSTPPALGLALAIGGLLLGLVSMARAEVKAALSTPSAGTAISIQAGSASAPGNGALLVTVDGLNPNVPAEANPTYLSKPADEPRAAAAPLNIRFAEPLALQASGGQRTWVLPFTVTDMPAGADQTRYLRFRLGDADKALPYRLTSPAATPGSWAVKQPPAGERAITPRQGVAIDISVTSAQRISGLKLGRVDLLEQGLKGVLGGGQLALCTTQHACSSQTHELSGNNLHTLWLMPLADDAGKPLARLRPGKYVGAVTVASTDKPGGESVSLTVHVTSGAWRALGVALIFTGVVLAWLATVFLRHRLNRNQLLLPAVALRETTARTRHQLQALHLPPGLGDTARRLALVDEALADDALLAKGLPARFPLPGTPPITSASTEALRAYLDGVGQWLAALQALISTGLQPLQARRASLTAKSTAHVAELDRSLLALDKLADAGNATAAAPKPDLLAQKVADETARLKTALDKLDNPGGVQLAPAPAGVAPAARHQPTVDSLRLQIATDSFAAWGFILLATLLAGSYMLVFRNTGFGTPLDLLEALLWGLGLPAAAQLTAATTTTSTIASSFSVVR